MMNSTRRLYRTIIFTAIILAGFMSVALAGQEAAGPAMPLEQALRQAYLYNPTLNAARSRLLATHELLPQADAGWKPTVEADAGIKAADTDNGGLTEKSLGASINQPLFRGGRTLAEIKAARHLIESQTQILRAREQEVLLSAATAYFDVYRDQQLVALSLHNRDIIARELEATNIRFEAGELTKTDVSQAQSRLAAADSAVIAARGALKTSRAVFEQVVGMPAGVLKRSTLKLSVPKNPEQAALDAENNSPVVLSAISAHRASEEDIGSALGKLLPEVGLFSSWSKVYEPVSGIADQETSKTIGIAASIPLYQAGAERSRVRQAKHTANQRYMEILETKRNVRQQAVSGWENLKTAQSEINARRAQVKAAAIAQEGVRSEAELGTRTVLDALDADQEVFDARTTLVKADHDEKIARFTLLATLGMLTPEALGFPEDEKSYTGELEAAPRKIIDIHVDRAGDGG